MRELLAGILPLLAVLLLAVALAVPVTGRAMRAFAAVAAVFVIVALVLAVAG